MQFLITLTDDFEFVHASLLQKTPLFALDSTVVELLFKETHLATLKVRQPEDIH